MEGKPGGKKEDSIEISLDEFDDYLEGPGFIMARKGRFILSQSTLSGDERRAFLQNIVDHQEDFRASIEQHVIELENILQQYNPFDVIGNISLLNSIHDIETYKEYEHSENPAYTEYLSLLLLTKPFDHYAVRTPHPISGEVIEDIQNRIQTLFSKQLLFLAFKDINPEQEQPDILQELRFQTLLRSIGVRALAYHHHLVDLLRGLFLPLGVELIRILGFDIEDVLSIADGIETIVNLKLSDRREQAIHFERDFQKAVKQYRHRKRVIHNYPESMLENLASLRPRDAKEKIRNLAVAWMFLGIGDTLSFTINDLLTQTKVEPDRIRNFLARFSIRFGNVDPTLYRVPAPTHPLTTKPIIEQGHQYFCPAPQLLYWGMRQAIEGMLNPNSPDAINKEALLWERYERARASFAEDKAIEYLGQALGHAKAYKRLKYHIIENGENKEVELLNFE
jgi:hypothetical protein